MKTLAVIVLGLCVGLSGCFRTTYRNLEIAGMPAPTDTAPRQVSARVDEGDRFVSWRHFFVYGWFPGEMLIPGDDICKSSGGLQEIRTKETFLQGLISAVQPYVVVYDPWDGRVVCVDDSRRATLRSRPQY